MRDFQFTQKVFHHRVGENFINITVLDAENRLKDRSREEIAIESWKPQSFLSDELKLNLKFA